MAPICSGQLLFTPGLLRLGSDSVERLLGVGLDCAVRSVNGHTGQHEPCCDLVLTEDELIILIHIPTDQLSGAGGAGSSTAGEWKINGLLRCSIQNRLVIGAVDRLIEPRVSI